MSSILECGIVNLNCAYTRIMKDCIAAKDSHTVFSIQLKMKQGRKTLKIDFVAKTIEFYR